MADTTQSTNPGTSVNAASPPATPSSASFTDPTSLRLVASSLIAGGGNTNQAIAGQAFNFNFVSQGGPVPPTQDWRIRISMQPTSAQYFYSANNPITRPLVATSGVVFPYTPSMTVQHSARYGATQLTHSNYSSYFYEGSEVAAISLTAEFTVQDVTEGQYLMAVIHFFRSCTKMFYGADNLAGTPPPMVFLNGYGPAYLPNVPCVVTQFSHTMPADVDYLECPVGISYTDANNGGSVNTQMFGSRTRLPTSSEVQLSLQPVYSRKNIADNFTLQKFAAAGLIQPSNAPSGGFI